MEGVSKYCMISLCLVAFVVVTTVPNLTTAKDVPEILPYAGLGSKECPSSRNIALTKKQKLQIEEAKRSGVIEDLSSNIRALYMHTKPIVTDFTDYQKKAIACKYGEMIQATKSEDEKKQSRRRRDSTARICPAPKIQSLFVFALNTDNNVVQIVQIHPDCEQIVIRQPCNGNTSPHVETTTGGSPIHCMTEYRAVPVVAVELTNDAVTGIGVEFIEVESCTTFFDV
eukprot:XP_011675636.1 PREDICTED: uncharacterized protein LOC105443762 [Strongylocentrotus purpuratus]